MTAVAPAAATASSPSGKGKNASELSLIHIFSKEEPGFISLVTILEIVWVLRRIFNRSRSEIADHIEKLLVADTLHVQNEQEVFSAMIDLRGGVGTFEDALIGLLGIWTGCSATLTFDEKAARRLRGFQLA